MKRNLIFVFGGFTLITILIFGSLNLGASTLRNDSTIDPKNIENLMQEQVDIGPRHPGSEGSLVFRDWILDKISDPWQIEIQNFTHLGIEVRNYWITSANSDQWPSYIIGAHYDSRKVADKDPDNPDQPVPGANDGASGVAAILEMMEQIPEGALDTIGFVLFDAEDQGSGGMLGWDWIVGSEYFVDQMSDTEVNATEFFILYDMIANDELILQYEGYSDDALNEEIFTMAHDLGYDEIFKKHEGIYVIDDHRPFLDRGIRAVDLIDLRGYPEHHTLDDNMDNVSAENAAIVVDVVLEWLIKSYWQLVISSTSGNSISETSESRFNSLYIFFALIPLLIISNNDRIKRLHSQD